ncbi:MAG: asparagine synthase (glutamine-hydrolyzing) [Planctomycetota bacterium]|jgi:asparagine synthase (glutamine-hydrolysing)
MCGIAGKLWFDPARPADIEGVAALTAALAHRGPDGEGLAQDGPLALGHRRLAIVDLSERAAQPMTSQDGHCLLVANGEIYNHLALREELTAAGHRFRSDCDNEVLLPLYREHWEREGPAFVNRIEGMAAFALWDGQARRLVLGRDRVGQKPVVYAHTDEGLVFASELAALVRDPLVDRAPDWQALADYLAFKTVPHPRTAYAGARKLPPGTVLVAEQGRVTLHRTWRPVPGSDVALSATLDEAAEEVDARLTRAVRMRLMSDVPVGAFLSGGLDSAAIVAAMAEASSGPVRTFTIGFDDPAYDETAEARRIARLFGTEHHEERFGPEAVSMLDGILAHYGEPFADASVLPTWIVSRLARRHVKVVLTGDGGDESFAGYDRHRALELARRLDSPWAAPARAMLGVAASVASGGGQGGRTARSRLARFQAGLALRPRRRNHLWRLALAPERLDALFTPEGRRLLGAPSFYGADVDLPLRLNEALAQDVERYLPDDPLVKLDVASMAHGLEARSPFLDRSLMEYAAALPGHYKLGRVPLGSGADGLPRGRLLSKRVLRHALRRRLPTDTLRGRKRGFGVPLDAWFRGPLLGPAREVLLGPDARRRGLFRPEAISRLLDDHVEGRVAAHETLLTLWVLERWFLSLENMS